MNRSLGCAVNQLTNLSPVLSVVARLCTLRRHVEFVSGGSRYLSVRAKYARAPASKCPYRRLKRRLDELNTLGAPPTMPDLEHGNPQTVGDREHLFPVAGGNAEPSSLSRLQEASSRRFRRVGTGDRRAESWERGYQRFHRPAPQVDRGAHTLLTDAESPFEQGLRAAGAD